MKKVNVKAVVLIMITVFFIFSACNKINDTKDILSAEEVSTANNLFDDVFKQINDAAKLVSEPGTQKSALLNEPDGGCASVNISPLDTTFPKTITIDFGSANCTGLDGRVRRGKITAVMSDWYRNPGSTLNITLDNYYVNDYKVEGSKTVTNSGWNDSQHLVFTIEVHNGVITDPDGTSFTWNTTRTREWMEGEETVLNILDDVFFINGDAHGVTSKGKDYSMIISAPLEVAVTCPWIKSGTIDITVGSSSLSVDYGDGTCDANATATILGTVVPFVMR